MGGGGENRTDNMIIEIMTERLQIEVMAMQTIYGRCDREKWLDLVRKYVRE